MLKTAKLSIILSLFISIVFFAQVASAQQVLPGNTNVNEESVKAKMDEAKTNKVQVAQYKTGTGAAMMAKNKLNESRLKICQSREERISNRFMNLKSLGAQMVQAHEGHVVKVDYFYNNTLVPQGFVLENYEVLKADMATKKTAVNTAMEQVRASGQDFSCSSEDPKAQADTFRINMSKLITANKEYKASVRAFVVAIRELAKESKDATLKVSPAVSPVVTPETVVSPTL